METYELHTIPELKGIQILNHDDPALQEILGPHRVHQVAEASDTRRLHHLLHREEYRPIVAVVECDNPRCKTVRVYFARLEDPTQSLPIKQGALPVETR